MENIGKDFRRENRLSRYIDPDYPAEKVPGVEILRSKNWARDHNLYALLEQYQSSEIDTIFKLTQKRFENQGLYDIDQLPVDQSKPSANQFLRNDIDFYEDTITDFDPDESSSDEDEDSTEEDDEEEEDYSELGEEHHSGGFGEEGEENDDDED